MYHRFICFIEIYWLNNIFAPILNLSCVYIGEGYAITPATANTHYFLALATLSSATEIEMNMILTAKVSKEGIIAT
jgi:hypothetical protein